LLLAVSHLWKEGSMQYEVIKWPRMNSHHLRVPGQKKPLCGNWETLDKANRVNLEHPPETLCTECWKHLTGVYAKPGVGNE
jgi:hypothetical protein